MLRPVPSVEGVTRPRPPVRRDAREEAPVTEPERRERTERAGAVQERRLRLPTDAVAGVIERPRNSTRGRLDEGEALPRCVERSETRRSQLPGAVGEVREQEEAIMSR